MWSLCPPSFPGFGPSVGRAGRRRGGEQRGWHRGPTLLSPFPCPRSAPVSPAQAQAPWGQDHPLGFPGCHLCLATAGTEAWRTGNCWCPTELLCGDLSPGASLALPVGTEGAPTFPLQSLPPSNGSQNDPRQIKLRVTLPNLILGDVRTPQL